MNVLVIRENGEKYDSIHSFFEMDTQNTYVYFERIFKNEDEYLERLIATVTQNGIEAVLSLAFYRFLSLACGVLKLPYLCWIVKGYEMESFDFTINNPWNRIFSADIDTYEMLSRRGVEVEYLPLSPTIHFEGNKVSTRDVLFVSKDVQNISSISLIMNSLKDSTKGYIDGILHAKQSDLREKSIYDSLAAYVRDDLEDCYPITNESFESKSHFYDYNMLLPALDNKYAYYMLYHLIASWSKSTYRIDVLTEQEITSAFDSDRITYYTREQFETEVIGGFGSYKLVVYFPSAAESNILSEEMLNIMAQKTILLLPGYVNKNVINHLGIKIFRNRTELDRLIADYLNRDSIRIDESNRIHQQINNIPSYQEKMWKILLSVNESAEW